MLALLTATTAAKPLIGVSGLRRHFHLAHRLAEVVSDDSFLQLLCAPGMNTLIARTEVQEVETDPWSPMLVTPMGIIVFGVAWPKWRGIVQVRNITVTADRSQETGQALEARLAQWCTRNRHHGYRLPGDLPFTYRSVPRFVPAKRATGRIRS